MAQKQARAFDISTTNEGKNDVEMLDSTKETEQKEQGIETKEDEDLFGDSFIPFCFGVTPVESEEINLK